MKSQFLTELEYEFIKLKARGPFGGKNTRKGIRLKAPLIYYSELLDKKILVTSGFCSDGASVPQVFWGIFPPFGKYLESAVVHDFFYYLARKNSAIVDKYTADKIFLESMTIQKIPRHRREIMYWAVDKFGYEFEEDKNNTIVI